MSRKDTGIIRICRGWRFRELGREARTRGDEVQFSVRGPDDLATGG